MPLPRMVRLRQSFERPQIENIAQTIRDQLAKLDLAQKIKPGQTVGLTAGSRGIANIPLILKSVVSFVKDLGAKPILIPAMGSHGGGTAHGQREVLESYGITEAFVGAPIHASMDVISLGNTPEGFPVYFDKIASECDHVAVVARIKPHTSYHGPIESGLLKMMMIGLGKHVGASNYHRLLLEHEYGEVVRAVAKVTLAKGKIAFGLGVVENAYDETAHIEAALPQHFVQVEEKLLTLAKKWLARLPFHEADLLIVDEIGKEISGSGMDTNIVGRKRAFKSKPPENQPTMRFIYIRGLSAHTHGNAAGIGMGDFTSTRLVQSMNYKNTVINCVTSGYPEGANLPVHMDTDRDVLEAVFGILGTRPPEKLRIMHIKNTLHVEEVEVSEACLKDSKAMTKFETVGGPKEIAFDAAGNIAAI